MTNMMETAQAQLRELLMDALGALTAEGKIAAEPLPAFKIEVPADTFPVRFATEFVAAIPVPASPSGGQSFAPG